MPAVITDTDIRGGRCTPQFLDAPAGSILNAAIPSNEQLDATKLKHWFYQAYSQPNTTATTVTIPLHVARFAGILTQLVAGSIVANIGAATVTVDLKKNNVSVLNSVLTLNSSNTARVVASASISGGSTAYVAGDFFELVITATAGGGTLATGLHVQGLFDERSQ